MRKTIFKLLVLAIISVLCNVVYAEPGEDIEKPNSDSLYIELVSQMENGEKDIDFTELRMAYANSSYYQPYGEDIEVDRSMRKAYSAGNYNTAIRHAKKIHEDNFLDIDSHIYCSMAYEKLNNDERSDYHRYIALGLLRSVAESGDGKTKESALIVISVAEEYAYLDMMGLKMKQQSLIEENGHEYDMLETEDIETGDKIVLYFNVDLPLKWFRKQLLK